MSDATDLFEEIVLVDPETGYRFDADENICDWDNNGEAALESFMIISEFSELFDDPGFLGRLMACQ